MPSLTPLFMEVEKDQCWIGRLQINYREWGWSYQYYCGDGSVDDASAKLREIANYVLPIIPTGSTIKNAVVVRPDTDPFGWPALNGDVDGRAINYVSPAVSPETSANGIGFVPNDVKTCLHIIIQTAAWRGREYFRLPPDSYVKNSRWIGPDIYSPTLYNRADEGTMPTQTVNVVTPVVGVDAYDGTYVENLRRYYWYLGHTVEKDFEIMPGPSTKVRLSQIQKIAFRRISSHKMGAAFRP